MSCPDPTLTLTDEDVDPAAMVELARCLRLGGYAFRRHATACAIEIKSQGRTPANTWMLAPIKSTSGSYAHYFASQRARDHVYNALRALQ